jgi:nitrogen fixation protein NifX
MAKVAVASTDGIHIDEHFGAAREYLIYEVKEAGNYALIEKLPAPVNAGNAGHSSAAIRAELLRGVEAVLTAQIGPNAEKILLDLGIKSFAVRSTIDEALKTYGRKRKIIKSLGIPSKIYRQASDACSGGCHK